MTSSFYRIGSLTESQTFAAQALLRDSFPAELHPYLAYCQEGVREYLRVIVATPAAYGGFSLYSATNDAGELVGFAEYRRASPHRELLTYLCVCHESRGSGLATEMLRQHLRSKPEVRTVELDVFATNTSAIRLYERLGFRHVRTQRWVRRSLPRGALSNSSKPVLLADWHVSYAAMQRYGFCLASGTSGGRDFRLGLTSSQVIRVGTRDDFEDDLLLAHVGSLVATAHSVFMIDSGTPAHNGSPLLEVRRMQADVDDVLRGSA